jgi:GMP reductase
MLYGLDDVVLIPNVVSNIEHRGDCNVYDNENMLPLFTAPMASVINDHNWEAYRKNKIYTIIPRTIGYDKRLRLCSETFVAFGLQDLEDFIKEQTVKDKVYICLDIANGHMQKAIDLCKKAKEIFGDNLVLMAGNIANPETYAEYARVGVDYVRFSVGSGSCCTTSANSGTHVPMASLILSAVEKKKDITYYLDSNPDTFRDIYKSVPKIIADGGFTNFDQIIKALALGADYVMLGQIFAKSEESLIGDNVSKKTYIHKKVIEREHFGMSTKKAQLIMGKAKEDLRTSEGVSKMVKVEYPLAKWCDNFKHYLQEAMSLLNCDTLFKFIDNGSWDYITPSAFQSYYK